MRSVLLIAVLALGGCGFAQGFRDESAKQAAELAGEYVEKKLGDDFAGVKEAVSGFKDAIPKKEPINDGLMYSAGALLAYFVGSLAKGKVREIRSTKKDAKA